MTLLVDQGASVVCAHMGQAQPVAVNPRVRLSGRPAVTSSVPWTVGGCPFPPNSGGPCVTAQWVSGTVRVTSLGQPLVVSTGAAVCAPTSVPLSVLVTQVRVRAQ
jgi:hypothetical protein